MTTYEYSKRIIKEKPWAFAKVVGLSSVVGLLESSGIALFIPVLQIIESQGSGEGGRAGQLVQAIFGFLGLPFTLAYLLAFIFFTVLVLQLMTLIQTAVLYFVKYQYELEIRSRLYSAIFAADWAFFLKQKLGDLTNAMTVEATRASDAIYVLGLLIGSSLMIAAYLVLAVLMSWQMTSIAFLIGVTVVVVLQKRVIRAREYGRAITAANSALQSEALEQLSAARLIKGSAVEDFTTRRFKGFLESLRSAYYKSSISAAILQVVYQPVVVGILCVTIYLAISVLHMQISKLIVFLFLFYRLSPRLSQVQAYRHSMGLLLSAIARVDDLCAEADSRRESSGSRPIDTVGKGVVFKDVVFEYVKGHPVVSNLDISVPAGKTVAIVGGSGAGKSTIIDLMLGLIIPKSGEVMVDGRPLAEYNISDWRRMISYVPQETILFHATVKENITWAKPDATEAELVEASREAYALEFINELPEGFNTVIGDRGVRLSGGQRQRLALARALLGKPKVLILDEATSALDAESEQKIQAAVEALSGSKMTIVVVTHRLATVKRADIIYVVEAGKLIETGTWAALSEQRGRLSTLKQLQTLD